MTDAYSKCRKCANFGTENCPESSLCFALNYKPFYKAKAKSKMKKKHRRAVCFAIGWIWLILLSPIFILGIIGEGCASLFEWLCKFYPADWLKTKLRVYDTDPD